MSFDNIKLWTFAIDFSIKASPVSLVQFVAWLKALEGKLGCPENSDFVCSNFKTQGVDAKKEGK